LSWRPLSGVDEAMLRWVMLEALAPSIGGSQKAAVLAVDLLDVSDAEVCEVVNTVRALGVEVVGIVGMG
jgi:hypothetical protein